MILYYHNVHSLRFYNHSLEFRTVVQTLRLLSLLPRYVGLFPITFCLPEVIFLSPLRRQKDEGPKRVPMETPQRVLWHEQSLFPGGRERVKRFHFTDVSTSDECLPGEPSKFIHQASRPSHGKQYRGLCWVPGRLTSITLFHRPTTYKELNYVRFSRLWYSEYHPYLCKTRS